MKRFEARETARLLGRPLQQADAATYARRITAAARVVTRLQAKRTKLRRALKQIERELADARRMLRLTAQVIEPLDQGELE